ncbi:adenylate/guanylate cyclase domain-containing protein (plasmid) [Agrobacterium tumefaciens]|nr:adenylate/guanylate cyclase domain-containing protein [Agrobacterium tumefaciens]
MDQISVPFGSSASSREIRSASLRFVVLSILFANLAFGDDFNNSSIHAVVSSIYLVTSIASVAAAIYFRERKKLGACFVIFDAMLVVVILYEHILASPVTEDHYLTTSSLVVSFILLNHVALKQDRKLILLFSLIVVAGWLLMHGAMAWRHHTMQPGSWVDNFFNQDLALTLSFIFTALAVYLLSRDHERTLTQALKIEEKRHNLSRFFSPTVVADLQNASGILDLERRNAAIMFIDIRGFTSYAESSPAHELARVLAEYRHIVAGTVFAFGGTVDKFIGDGVMAVFGQPRPRADDVERALKCALELTTTLETWRLRNISEGGPDLNTGIGLHYGTVLGGVLESGFHDEFTVIGDAVNVAQRLETIAKILQSPLVVSESVINEVTEFIEGSLWVRKSGIKVPGRNASLNIAYLRQDVLNRLAFRKSARCTEPSANLPSNHPRQPQG